MDGESAASAPPLERKPRAQFSELIEMLDRLPKEITTRGESNAVSKSQNNLIAELTKYVNPIIEKEVANHIQAMKKSSPFQKFQEEVAELHGILEKEETEGEIPGSTKNSVAQMQKNWSEIFRNKIEANNMKLNKLMSEVDKKRQEFKNIMTQLNAIE